MDYRKGFWYGLGNAVVVLSSFFGSLLFAAGILMIWLTENYAEDGRSAVKIALFLFVLAFALSEHLNRVDRRHLRRNPPPAPLEEPSDSRRAQDSPAFLSDEYLLKEEKRRKPLRNEDEGDFRIQPLPRQRE